MGESFQDYSRIQDFMLNKALCFVFCLPDDNQQFKLECVKFV